MSSEPDGRHHLPDLVGSAIFAKFDDGNNQLAALTRDTGTVHLTVNPAGTRTLEFFGDSPSDDIGLGAGRPLNESTNPTDWPGLLEKRAASL